MDLHISGKVLTFLRDLVLDHPFQQLPPAFPRHCPPLSNLVFFPVNLLRSGCCVIDGDFREAGTLSGGDTTNDSVGLFPDP